MADEITKEEFAWIYEVFKKVEVFTGLNYAERETLIEEMYKLSYKPEDNIFKEGDAPNAYFLIYKGNAKVIKNKRLVIKKEVTTIGPGSFFWGNGFSHLRASRRYGDCRNGPGLFRSTQINVSTFTGKNSAFKSWFEILSAKRMVKLDSI